MINIVVVIDENNAIGKNGGLLCHLPADLKHFKEITWNHTILMGSKTYESLPVKPLPNRRNIVLTTNPAKVFEGAEVIHSIEELSTKIDVEKEDLYVIGGGKVYEQFLPLADRLYVTKIYHTWEDADTFFPKIDLNDWVDTEYIGHSRDDKNPYDYAFIEWRRRK